MDNKKVCKEWIEKEIEDCVKFNGDAQACLDRCYGVIMFVNNAVLDEYDEELANWWEDVVISKFQKM